MADRVSSDHPSVHAIRATVERAGSTRRPEVRLPASDADRVPDGVVRLVVDGREYRAPVDGDVIRGAYGNARLARERDGTNRLAAWIDEHDLGFGRAVLVDVVVPEFRFGLRRPGEQAVYDASEPPDGGLRDIAEGLDGD